MRTPTSVGIGDHDNCVVDVAAELFHKGYSVYPEYSFYLKEGTNMNGKRLVVDIYAFKGQKEIIVEVGSISASHTSCVLGPVFVADERFRLLKQLCPGAKIIHVTQWKNWMTNDEFWAAWTDEYYRIHEREIEQRMEKAIAVDKYLARGPRIVSDEEMTRMGRSLVKKQQQR